MLKKLDHSWTQGEWLNFRDEGIVSPGAVTHRFAVTNRKSGTLLGYVKWWSQWREYVFASCTAIYNPKCLREAADFCEQATREHREKRK